MADRNVELARAASRRQCVALSLPSVNSSTATSNWHGGEPNGPGSCRDHALRFLSGSKVIRGGRFEFVDVVGARDNLVVIMRPPAHGAGPAAPVASLATCRDDRVIEIVSCPDAREATTAHARLLRKQTGAIDVEPLEGSARRRSARSRTPCAAASTRR